MSHPISSYGSFSLEGKHHANEDTYTVKRRFFKNEFIELTYASIHDGHGGSFCAYYVKRYLHLNILNELKLLMDNFSIDNDNIDQIIVTSLLNGFAKTEEDFISISKKENEFSGACVNTVLISNDKIYVANLGDCRSILFRQFGKELKAIPLSRDHKAKLEVSRITNSGGYVKNGRVNGILAISRTIGDREFKDPLKKNDMNKNHPQTKKKRESVNKKDLTIQRLRRISDPIRIKLTDLSKSASETNIISSNNSNNLNNNGNNLKLKSTVIKSASTNKINVHKKKKELKSISVNIKKDKVDDEKEIQEDIPKDFIIINCFDIGNIDNNSKIPPMDPNHVFNETIVSAIPEITIVPRQDNDIMILIGSDGLYDFFPNQKIGNSILRSLKKADIVNKESLTRICEKLCKKSKCRGSEDDITSVLISLKQS